MEGRGEQEQKTIREAEEHREEEEKSGGGGAGETSKSFEMFSSAPFSPELLNLQTSERERKKITYYLLSFEMFINQ